MCSLSDLLPDMLAFLRKSASERGEVLLEDLMEATAAGAICYVCLNDSEMVFYMLPPLDVDVTDHKPFPSPIKLIHISRIYDIEEKLYFIVSGVEYVFSCRRAREFAEQVRAILKKLC